MKQTSGSSHLGRASLIRIATAAVVLAPSWGVAAVSPKERPNILLIMADDMGWSDIGCYGGEIDTPNIDRLAEQGMRFTQFYNTAKCFPTRAALLTGLYSHQTGLGNKLQAFNKNCVTLGEVFSAEGYRTLMTGKWHAEKTPYRRGFSRYYGLTDGCCNYFNPGIEPLPGQGKPGRKYDRPRRWAIDDQEYLPYTPDTPNFYTTDAFSDYAVNYLEAYRGEGKPFLLYVADTAPHYPLHAWPQDIAKYRGKYMIGWDKLRERRYRRQLEMGLFDATVSLSPRDENVPLWASLSEEKRDYWDLKMSIYAAMIDRMDRGIGRILDKIQALGELENTLVMFLADNGACPSGFDKIPNTLPGTVESYSGVGEGRANASNNPFRKYKVWDHEGGICTPFIAYWPKVITESGAITTQVGHIMDVMATCVDIAGATYPQTYRGSEIIPMEGKSLLPIFKGKTRAGHETVGWQYSHSSALRQGQWKLVRNTKTGPGRWELYNLAIDRTEQNNLAQQYPEKVRTLSAAFDAWVDRCGVEILQKKSENL